MPSGDTSDLLARWGVWRKQYPDYNTSAGRAKGHGVLQFLAIYNKNHQTSYRQSDLPGGTLTSSTTSTPSSEKLADKVSRDLPQLAPYLKVPELHSIFVDWFNNRIDTNILMARIQGSEYYRTRNETQRVFTTLGPADRELSITEIQAKLYQWYLTNASTEFLKKAGITSMESDFVRWRAYRIAKGDTTWEEMISHWTGVLLKDFPESPIAHSIEAERVAARDFSQRDENFLEEIYNNATTNYFLPNPKESYITLAKKRAAGEISDGDIVDILRTQSLELFPRYAAQIKRGVLPSQFLDPKLRIISQEIDISADELRADPKVWEKILADAASDAEPMSGMDWVRYARSLPQWLESQGARRGSSDLMSSFSQAFGRSVGA